MVNAVRHDTGLASAAHDDRLSANALALDHLAHTPQEFDFFAAMRLLERSAPDAPRIGRSDHSGNDIVRLRQDPYTAYPFANVTAFDRREGEVPSLSCRFLGYFGPNGALPLATTLETSHWSKRGDDSFASFANLFANRFLQLFFRVWSDSRAITQSDRQNEDQFASFLGSFAGIGSEAFSARDCVEDVAKLPFVGLLSTQMRSAGRLQQFLSGMLGVSVEIEEYVGSWLVFEREDRLALGKGGALGIDTMVGDRVYSINERFRISIKMRTMEEYRSFLPGGAMAARLQALVFLNLGHRFAYQVVLAVPVAEVKPVQLGSSGELGWTTWLDPDQSHTPDGYLRDTRIDHTALEAQTTGT